MRKTHNKSVVLPTPATKGFVQQSLHGLACSHHEGLDVMGMPFEGISIVGYDNAKKVFVNSWIDNMGTGLMMLEGKWEKPGKTITYLGKCTDPLTGKDMKVRQVMTIESEKSQYMEMYMTENGKERKTMELRITKI